MASPFLSMMVFAAVALGLLAVYSVATDLLFRDRSRLGRRIDESFRGQLRQKAERLILLKDVIQAGDGQPGWKARFAAMIEQSGLETTQKRVLTSAAVAGVATGLVAALFFGPLGALAAPVGAALPIARVHLCRVKRREKLRSQLPDTFDLMARVVRSGQSMGQAMLAVADEFAPPVAEEFSLCYEEQNLGLPTDEAYQHLASRSDVVELRLFVMATLVQQQTGGNLAELLEKLAGLLRERAKILGTVKSLTAEGRMQAILLMALPPFLFFFMLVVNGDYARRLLTAPKVLMGTVALEVLGALWIRKIVNFDF